MIDVLKNEHPCWVVLSPMLGSEVRAAHQGKVEGYSTAIANLEAMRIFHKTVELTDPTFEPENDQ